MKWAKYFGIAVLFAYASNWGPYYVSLFFGEHSTILGSLEQYKRACPAQNMGDVICKAEYLIPGKQIALVDNAQSIGFGKLIHATEIGCAETLFTPKIRYGDVSQAGKVLDFLNIYQTASLKELNCRGDILVRAWSPAAYRRHGLIDGLTVIGDVNYVARVQKFVEFFSTDFLVFMTAIFFLIFVFNRVLQAITRDTERRSPIDEYEWAWIGFMFIFSGMANAIFPIVSSSFLVTRLSNFFGLVAMIAPGICALKKSHSAPLPIVRIASLLITKHARLRFSIFYLLTITFILSPFFAKGLGPLYLSTSLIFSSVGILSRDSFLLFFGLASMSDALKILMVPHLPTSYLLMCFSLLALLDSFVNRVKRGARITESLHWARSTVEQFIGQDDIAPILQNFADRFCIGQITLIVPAQDGNCEITIIKKAGGEWLRNTFLKDRLPAVFSYALTTRESLWHIEEDSLFALNIRKGEQQTSHYDGKHFSVIPLLHTSLPIAAIGFTNYPEILANNGSHRIELTSVASLLFPFLERAITTRNLSADSDWKSLSQNVSAEISEIKLNDSTTDDAMLTEIAMIIAHHTKGGCYIGQLDPITRRIHIRAMAGFEKEVENLYAQAQFYAVSHNEQGPIALSINRKRPVTVGDVNWIKSVLHPITLNIFARSGIRSCAAVPIMNSISAETMDRDDSDVWGLLWVEHQDQGYFRPTHEVGLQAIARAIERGIDRRSIVAAHTRAKRALSGFVPDNVLGSLIEGQSVRQEDSGFLLMADLRDSTKLSRQIGADAWNEFVSTLAGPVKWIAEKHGFTLQTIIWDAFYFTKSDHSQKKNYQAAIDCALELSQLFEEAFLDRFPNMSFDAHLPRARYCLSYGDITRDVRVSITSNWTIVGAAMAAVSKLEQACKGANGWFFASDSALAGNSNLKIEWDTLGTTVSGTGESVYRIRSQFTKFRLPNSKIKELWKNTKKDLIARSAA